MGAKFQELDRVAADLDMAMRCDAMSQAIFTVVPFQILFWFFKPRQPDWAKLFQLEAISHFFRSHVVVRPSATEIGRIEGIGAVGHFRPGEIAVVIPRDHPSMPFGS